ncbi:MAG: hypothetical protein V4538_13045 [Bacteroidota bacterium]
MKKILIIAAFAAFAFASKAQTTVAPSQSLQVAAPSEELIVVDDKPAKAEDKKDKKSADKKAETKECADKKDKKCSSKKQCCAKKAEKTDAVKTEEPK